MNDKGMTGRHGATLVTCFIVGSVLLTPVRTSAQPPEDWCCEGTVGDVDTSGVVDITDLSIIIDNMFLTFAPLPCWGEADFDQNYRIDIVDLSLFIEWTRPFTWPGMPDCAPPPLYGIMGPLTGCKATGVSAAAAVDSLPPGSSCILWEYDGQGLLSIEHTDATLNCCPEGEAEITIAAGQITVDETPIDGLCDCICLFDVDFTVSNLQAGEYTIVVNEPYWQAPQETFEFTVDLNTSPTGMVCIDRNL